jgi:hypothetical protein
MSGVIDDNGVQWEHCHGCGEFVQIELLLYEEKSAGHPYGRDLCPKCAGSDAKPETLVRISFDETTGRTRAVVVPPYEKGLVH